MAGNYQKPSISTNSVTFFNDERAMLKVVYFDDAMTVSIFLPQIVDGKATYPKEMRHQVLINQANVSALHSLIMEEILPAYERGENKDAGVFTNRHKSQMLEAMVMGGNFYVVIHDGIENRVPKNTYMFKFEKTTIIKNYDVAAVSFETEDIDAEFTLFVKALEAFENLSNGLTAHEYQYRQSYFINNLMKYLYAMNDKLGLGVYRPDYSSNAGSGGGFDAGAGSTIGNQVEVHQGSMNDLFPGMGDSLPFN